MLKIEVCKYPSRSYPKTIIENIIPPVRISPPFFLASFSKQDGLLISLPITVDDVPKELMIFEGDEPMEAVLAFCNENMPDEGAACADQLFHVVQDNFADFGNLELDKS